MANKRVIEARCKRCSHPKVLVCLYTVVQRSTQLTKCLETTATNKALVGESLASMTVELAQKLRISEISFICNQKGSKKRQFRRLMKVLEAKTNKWYSWSIDMQCGSKARPFTNAVTRKQGLSLYFSEIGHVTTAWARNLSLYSICKTKMKWETLQKSLFADSTSTTERTYGAELYLVMRELPLINSIASNEIIQYLYRKRKWQS